MPVLAIEDIQKQFADGFDVLRGISLEAQPGEIVCLLGPSGCGKTTLLRIIAGLEKPDTGRVILDGQDMGQIPVHRRGIGLMFQDFALFPHQNVWGNVAFGLRMQGLPRPEINQRVSETLNLVNLGSLARRDVHQLSGGERQRVALARSLAPRPHLLLLDEPMGSLDRTLRDRLLEDLRDILKRVHVTTIYVTHDQTEAFAIADRVILMNEGRIVQAGWPEEVYRQPINAWAARFLGMRNILAGTWVEAGRIETSIGRLRVNGSGQGATTVLIRPEAGLLRCEHTDLDTPVGGVVCSRAFLGATARLTVECADTLLTLDLPTTDDLAGLGQPITVYLQPAGIVCLPLNSDPAEPPADAP